MAMTSGPSWVRQIPPVTRNLILINVLVWLAEILVPKLGGIIMGKLSLHFWGAEQFNPVQLLTYMFVHDNSSVLHILFNMFTLWMFGRLMEHVWGSRRFFVFYMVCGVGAAIVQEVVWQFSWYDTYVSGIAAINHVSLADAEAYIRQRIVLGDPEVATGIALLKNSMVCVGASGAIFGILLGFAFVFPNMPMYLFFIPIGIKAKYMVIGYAVLEFFLGVSGTGGTVAHFAHLGGMIFGLMLLLYWRHKGTLRGNNFMY